RHYQTIWLLVQGHTIEETAETTCFVPRWIEELLARYNAIGPQALGDLRRNNGAPPSVLKPELLAKLKVRLQEPPPDGGLWTSSRAHIGWRANSAWPKLACSASSASISSLCAMSAFARAIFASSMFLSYGWLKQSGGCPARIPRVSKHVAR